MPKSPRMKRARNHAQGDAGDSPQARIRFEESFFGEMRRDWMEDGDRELTIFDGTELYESFFFALLIVEFAEAEGTESSVLRRQRRRAESGRSEAAGTGGGELVSWRLGRTISI